MTIFGGIRIWLASVAVALPAILAPSLEGMSMHGVYYDVGWPATIIYLHLYPDHDRSVLHFQINWLLLLPVVAAWIIAMRFLWEVRQWAIVYPSWRGAFLQALLASGYCSLLFFFFYGAVNIGWDAYLEPMTSPALVNAIQLGRRLLVLLYECGLACIGVLLYLDARSRQRAQRSFHFGAFLCFTAGYYCVAPLISWQMRIMDEQISIVQKMIQQGH